MNRRRQTYQKPKNVGKTLKRIFAYMLENKFKLLLVALFVGVSSLAGVVGTYLLRPLINDSIVPMIGSDIDSMNLSVFIRTLLLMGGVYILGVVGTYTYNRLMITISNNALRSIRKELFDKLQDLPIQYFDTHTHGELMSRFSNDVDTLRTALNQATTQLFSSIITVVGTFTAMLILSPILTVLIIIMLVVISIVTKFIGTRSAANYKGQQKNVGRVNGYIEEMIEGQKVVKVFCYEEEVKSEFSELNDQLRESATKANIYANMIMPINSNISYVNFAMTAMIGALMVISGRLDIGTIASFLQYTRTFARPITQISQQFNFVLAALAGAERIFQVIDETPEADDGFVTLVNVIESTEGILTECEECTETWAWKIEDENGIKLIKVQGDVRFEDVTFSYDGSVTVLNDISLYAKPGQKIAFVGSTGAGKTTITNLINRFYDIEQGKILYDGIDIKTIKKPDLRRSLAMVLQDTHLFTETVMENIRYGNLEATDEEVIEAAKLANAHYFIEHLPQGYDTMLTSDGTNLSQGQRQLLSIARAAVANPPVLILDEATSSIDTRTEALIEKGMDRLMKGRTVFVIAHRLSTVRNADAIIVLEQGEIIERGNHDALLQNKGRYYQLYTGQFELE